MQQHPIRATQGGVRDSRSPPGAAVATPRTADDRFSEADRLHMARAIALAHRGLYTAHPNPRVGCVLVRDGQRVGEGWHARTGGPHAEAHALDLAGESARGATAYVSLEPCCHVGRTDPCTERLREAGIRRVVAAMLDPDPRVRGRGAAFLGENGIPIETGLMEREAAELNLGFSLRMHRRRPFVRCKLAMSMDGRTGLANGESRWITGPPARTDAHRLRARSGAILTGIGTALHDDPALTVRHVDAGELYPDDAVAPPIQQPLRVVLDSSLRLPPQAVLVREAGESLVLHAGSSMADDASPSTARSRSGLEARAQALRKAGAQVQQMPSPAEPSGTGLIDPTAVLNLLAERGINEVLLECGPTLAGAMLSRGLVDELVIYMAPCLLGPDAQPLLDLAPLTAMSSRRQFQWIEQSRLGDDLRLVLRPIADSSESEGPGWTGSVPVATASLVTGEE